MKQRTKSKYFPFFLSAFLIVAMLAMPLIAVRADRQYTNINYNTQINQRNLYWHSASNMTAINTNFTSFYVVGSGINTEFNTMYSNETIGIISVSVNSSKLLSNTVISASVTSMKTSFTLNMTQVINCTIIDLILTYPDNTTTKIFSVNTTLPAFYKISNITPIVKNPFRFDLKKNGNYFDKGFVNFRMNFSVMVTVIISPPPSSTIVTCYFPIWILLFMCALVFVICLAVYQLVQDIRRKRSGQYTTRKFIMNVIVDVAAIVFFIWALAFIYSFYFLGCNAIVWT